MHQLDVAVPVFVVGTMVSLATSWLLVSRLEAIGQRLAISDALLGLIAALAADAPEITSSVSAVLQHQRSVGAGVVLGSNVFNLAALLGLSALVAGAVRVHRRVVVFAGTVSTGIALFCELAVTGVLPAGAGLAGVLVLLAAYGGALALDVERLARLRLPPSLCNWLCLAVGEEDEEVASALPPPGGRYDALLAAAALVVVVLASVAMERAATSLGTRFAVPGIVTGGLVLGAVTSLPNAVAAVYLARRGRGAAVLSTALNSNAINVAFGLLIPGVVLGLGPVTGSVDLVASFYLGLTAASLLLAFGRGSLRRADGTAIIGGYVLFAICLLAVSGVV